MKRYTKVGIIMVTLGVSLLLVFAYEIGKKDGIEESKLDGILEQGSKDWWYGAAVGCMEETGYWNASKQFSIDQNQSLTFQYGKNEAINTIRHLNKQRNNS